MEKTKIAIVGVGGISQVARIPYLKKREDVELVALCDIDGAKASAIANKFKIPNYYYDVQNLIRTEKVDGILVCTPNNLHYPIALASLNSKIPTMVEKPLALNAKQAEKLVAAAKNNNTLLMVGMNNRFREDAVILKDFMSKDELGQPYYIKTGWLKRWNKNLQQGWFTDKKIAGGGVIMDLGIQLIDLSLWLLGLPEIKNVRAYNYNTFTKSDTEDSALIVIETVTNVVVTIEVSWRMHQEQDMIYTNVFGREGGAFLNPLRLNKELHGNLVNVTPTQQGSGAELFKRGFENELNNFIECLQGRAKPVTPGEDGLYIMKIIDAIYESASTGQQVSL
jgi:predicted dehydrogenase